MKKHTLWLTEFLVWVLVLFGALFVGAYLYSVHIKKNYTYYAFFNDVDGLIKGSPVKMLGYQIGYVSDISLINNDDVFVTFVITEKDITMPDSMVATVEFTGMGGSKSLELYMPKEGSLAKNYISTTEPKRLQDFYVYQNQIATDLITMTTNFMNMMTPKNTDTVVNFIKDPIALEQIHNILDIVHNKESKLLEKRRNNEKNTEK